MPGASRPPRSRPSLRAQFRARAATSSQGRGRPSRAGMLCVPSRRLLAFLWCRRIAVRGSDFTRIHPAATIRPPSEEVARNSAANDERGDRGPPHRRIRPAPRRYYATRQRSGRHLLMRPAVLAVIVLTGCSGHVQDGPVATPETPRGRHQQCIVDPVRAADPVPAPAGDWMRELEAPSSPPDACRAPADCSYARSL